MKRRRRADSQTVNRRNAYLVSLLLGLIISGSVVTGAFRHSSAVQTPGLREVHRIRLASYVNAVAWNTDGTQLATLSDFGGIITEWNVKDWSRVSEFHRIGGAYSGNSFAYLPDGALLTNAPLGVNNTLSLLLWDAATGKPLTEISGPSSRTTPHFNIAETFVVSKDGADVAAIPIRDTGHVVVFDSKNWTITRVLNVPPTATHPDFADALAMSPDGNEVAIGTGFGYVRFFSLKTGALRRSILAFPDGSICDAIAISPDGRLVAVGRWAGNSADQNTLTIWRVSDGEHVGSFPGTAQVVRTLAWDPATDRLAVGDDDSLRVFEFRDTDQRLLFSRSLKGVFSVAFSPTGVLAVAAGPEVVIFQ